MKETRSRGWNARTEERDSKGRFKSGERRKGSASCGIAGRHSDRTEKRDRFEWDE